MAGNGAGDSSSSPPSPSLSAGDMDEMLLKKLMEQNSLLEKDGKFTTQITSSPSPSTSTSVSNLSSLPSTSSLSNIRSPSNLQTPPTSSSLTNIRAPSSINTNSELCSDHQDDMGSKVVTTLPDSKGGGVTTPSDDPPPISTNKTTLTSPGDDLCTFASATTSASASNHATPTSDDAMPTSKDIDCESPLPSQIQAPPTTEDHAIPTSTEGQTTPPPSESPSMLIDSPTEVRRKPTTSSYSASSTPAYEDGEGEGEGLGPDASIVLEEENLDTLIPYNEVVRLEELKEEDEEEEDDFDLEAHTLSPDNPSHMTATPSSTVESRDVLSDLPGGLRGGPSSHHTHPHHPNKKRVRSDTESRIMRTFIPFKTRKRSQTIQEGASPKEKEEGPDDKPLSSEESQWQQWSEILKNWEEVSSKNGKLVRQMCYQGVPEHLRGMAWQLLSNSIDPELKDIYPALIIETSPHERAIRRDLNRTFPEHDFFKDRDGVGQESLFNVLKAYSLYDKEVGYCQGSPFIAGLLLMQMPEEETFCVLVRLMTTHKLREMYKPSMTDLSICFYQLDKLIEEFFPPLCMHFKAVGFQTSMFASPWFLTMFASVLALKTAFRVMDILLVEGRDIIFRVGMALLEASQDKLVHMDMEDMIKHFQKEMKLLHADKDEELMARALRFKLSSKKMKKFAKEYSEKKARKTLEINELGKLQNENMDLSQKLIQLQHEFESLKEQLINGQITRAQEAEEIILLRNELSVARKKIAKLEKQELPNSNCRGNDTSNAVPDWMEDNKSHVKLPLTSIHGNSPSSTHSEKATAPSSSPPTISPVRGEEEEGGEEEEEEEERGRGLKNLIYNSFDSNNFDDPFVIKGQLQVQGEGGRSQGAGSKENLFIAKDTPTSSPALTHPQGEKKKKKKRLLRRSKSERKGKYVVRSTSCDPEHESTGSPPPLASSPGTGGLPPPSPSGGSSGGRKEEKKKKKKKDKDRDRDGSELEKELTAVRISCADYENQFEKKSLELAQALERETFLIRELKEVKEQMEEKVYRKLCPECQSRVIPLEITSVQAPPPSEDTGPNSSKELLTNVWNSSPQSSKRRDDEK